MIFSTNFFSKAILFAIAYLTPISGLFAAVIIFIAIDWLTGLYASVKIKRKISSFRLRRTIEKFVFYTLAIALSFILQKEILFDWNITNIIAGYIAITEIKSIFENIAKITNLNLSETLETYLKDKANKFFTPKEKKEKKHKKD